MKVNLSRIHNMIKQASDEMRDKYNQVRQPFLAGYGVFSINIFEGTTDEDLDAFWKK